MAFLYGEDSENKIHLNSIEVLANKLCKPRGDVALIYANVFDDLQKQASVKIFLLLLISKKVKELIG
jgi:hypothetical protein